MHFFPLLVYCNYCTLHSITAIKQTPQCVAQLVFANRCMHITHEGSSTAGVVMGIYANRKLGDAAQMTCKPLATE